MCSLAASLSPAEKVALANHFEQQQFRPTSQTYNSSLADSGALLHHDRGCETCHSQGGRDGLGMAPILNGQRTPYLRNAFQQLRSGKRRGPKVMNQALAILTDDEIEALLNYYARND
jgi:sulfide dehydrogenase cytochrome subunit